MKPNRSPRLPDSPQQAGTDDTVPCGTAGGFLLVEVLISLFLLTITLTALIPMVIVAAKENMTARDLTLAGTAAQDKAEFLRTLDYAAVVAGADVVAVNKRTFSRAWSIELNQPASGMKTVTVTVTPGQKSLFGPAKVTIFRFYLAE